MIPSVYGDEQKLLQALILLHIPNGIDADPMFFKGNFYKTVKRPRLVFDINPQVGYCLQGDARNLPLESSTLSSIVLDPPFMFGVHGKTKNYYSSKTHGILKNFEELQCLYTDILKEAYRILKNKGILVFKCQDFTDSKTTMVHCFVWQWAIQLGFYPKDLFILHLPKNKVYNSNLVQRHARKVHSYFWVFQK